MQDLQENLLTNEQGKPMGKPPKRNFGQLLKRIGIAAIALAVLIACVYFYACKTTAAKYEDDAVMYAEVSSEIVMSVISSEMKEIGELSSIEYLYTDVGKFSNPKQFFGKDIPFTTKSFIVKWDGIIKAGVDISKMDANVSESKRVITVSLPQATILSNEVDNNSLETLDEKNNIFNSIKVDDVNLVLKESKAEMEQRAIDAGLLKKAYKNATTIVEDLLNTNPAIEKNYEIVFESMDD